MIGLTYKLTRDSECDLVEKRIVLATARGGRGAGPAMQKALADYKAALFAIDRANQRFDTRNRRAMAVGPDHEDYVELRDAATDAYSMAEEATVRMHEAREQIVRLSLEVNYGEEAAEGILSLLTEHDLTACVSLIQCGMLPADFTPYPGAPQSSSSTEPSGVPPVEPLPEQASAGATSSGDE